MAADMGKGTISALRIIGLVYLPLGAVFVVLGVVFSLLLRESVPFLGMIFALVGMPFLLLGIIFLSVERGKQKKAEALISSGRYVWGTVVDWRENRSITICGSHPYILMVRCLNGRGQERVLQSPSIRVAAGQEILGKQVRVYYKDPDFHEYYVAVEQALSFGKTSNYK